MSRGETLLWRNHFTNLDSLHLFIPAVPLETKVASKIKSFIKANVLTVWGSFATLPRSEVSLDESLFLRDLRRSSIWNWKYHGKEKNLG